jgi:zinc transport system ATP-binding protein
MTPTADPVSSAVAAQGLSVRIGDYRVLDGLDFQLPAGSFMTIVGPNGGGKTTLLRAILGLQAPAAGRIEVLGRAPADLETDWIGYVPQLKTLDRDFPARAIELVATGLLGRWPGRISPADCARAHEALQQVDGVKLASRPLAALSGGELQRVYLARAIVRRPRLILLDEPAAGMDVAGEADLYGILEDYQRHSGPHRTGATVIMITHDWDATRHHSSHVLVLNRRLISFGPPAEALGEGHLERAFGHVGHPHKQRHQHAGEPHDPPGRGERG